MRITGLGSHNVALRLVEISRHRLCDLRVSSPIESADESIGHHFECRFHYNGGDVGVGTSSPTANLELDLAFSGDVTNLLLRNPLETWSVHLTSSIVTVSYSNQPLHPVAISKHSTSVLSASPSDIPIPQFTGHLRLNMLTAMWASERFIQMQFLEQI